MKKKNLFLCLLTLLVLLGGISSAQAGWLSWDKKNMPPEKVVSDELSDAGKQAAAAKYALWYQAFEKGELDAIASGRGNFRFTLAELKYIMATESAKVKKPLFTNFDIKDNQGQPAITADFHRFVRGRLSFSFTVTSVNDKAKIKVGRARIFGLPVPSSWLENPFNKALDEYFAKLYKDPRYQGFSFSYQDEVMEITIKMK